MTRATRWWWAGVLAMSALLIAFVYHALVLGNAHASQNSHDGHDDHNLNEGETASRLLHSQFLDWKRKGPLGFSTLLHQQPLARHFPFQNFPALFH